MPEQTAAEQKQESDDRQLRARHSLRATLANASRLVERPIGWDDKVWLTWPREGGVLLTS